MLENFIKTFLYQHDLKYHLKDQDCFKNPNNPNNTDLLWINNSLASQNTKTVFIGLSDCHKLGLTVLNLVLT